MLRSLITKDRIQITESQTDWESAIRRLCIPLINDGSIEQRYIDAIIDSTNKLGPYYVLGPSIAMPHARPEQGVMNNGLALLIVKNGVNFNSEENDPVKLLLLLAAKNSNNHIELIQSISQLFCNEEDVNKIVESNNINMVLDVLANY